MVLIKEEASEERRPGVSQMDLETLNVKEEVEEPFNEYEMMETYDTSVSPTAGFCQFQEDEDKVLLFNQHQATDRDLPTSSCPDYMKTVSDGEDCGGTESDRNPDLNPYEDNSNSSETEISENEDDQFANSCDCHLKPLSDSDPETEHGNKEWNENRSAESDVKAVDKPLSCPECGKPVLRKCLPQKHVKVTSLTAISSSSCWSNKKGDGMKQNVDACMAVQTEEKLFSCDFCGKTFNHKSNYNNHIRVHTGQKPFTCDVCGQTFSEKSSLNRHTRVHTGQKPFICDVCGQKFRQKTHLNGHMRVHTGQKPFACELCGQRFSQKTSLNYHLRVHTGQKPFACDVCGNSFGQKKILKIHMRVHTGQKPFECKICGQKFSLNAHLNRHLSVHTGHKPFTCDVCGKGFSQKANLNTHMRVHTGQKPFVCDVCGERFRHKISLNAHTQVHTAKP
ncbi:zinc finger protein OZF [Nothobranchius furzeri]|uniref:zinc finger protein OZF n=1 Tax=Nothobranchius furzeri TaxID=105023 RepID=UPI00077CF153|nr:zinc finger protein OZF [Nothobranchius furzeri]